MRRIIAVFLLVCAPSVALADDPVQQPGGNIAIITKGKPAPWDGFLYDNFAFAKSQADAKSQDDQFKLKLNYELQMQEARLRFTTSTTAAALDALKHEKVRVDDINSKHITSLEKQLVDANDRAASSSTKLMIAGSVGIIIGIGLTVLSGWAIHQAAK